MISEIIIFISILGFALIKADLWTVLNPLLFQPSGYAFFQQHVQSSNMNLPHSLGVLICRLGLLIYLMFLIPIVLVYTCVFGHRYQENYWNQMWVLIRNPLLLPPFLCSWKGGMYTFMENTRLALQLQSKEFWHQLFEQARVPYPKVVGSLENGDVTWFAASHKKEYIIKPVVGGLGNGIAMFDATQVPKTGSYMIQERIQQDVPWHVRIVTVRMVDRDIRVVSAYILVAASSDRLTSNAAQGGFVYTLDMDNNRVRNAQMLDWKPNRMMDTSQVQRIKEDAFLLHGHLPSDVITVGWDIVIDKDGDHYFLEGNVPAGTLHSEDRMFYKRAVDIDSLVDGAMETR